MNGVAVKAIANVLTGLVALSHLGILVLEMFFWDYPVGRRIFGMTPEVSASSAVLAANQGLYNGVLAAGLLWALWADRRELKIFFLGWHDGKDLDPVHASIARRDRARRGGSCLEAPRPLTPSPDRGTVAAGIDRAHSTSGGRPR